MFNIFPPNKMKVEQKGWAERLGGRLPFPCLLCRSQRQALKHAKEWEISKEKMAGKEDTMTGGDCWHPETMPASSATPHHDSLPGEDMVSPDSVALCSLRDGKTLNMCRSTRLSSSVPSPTLTPWYPLRSQAVRQSTVKKLGNWGCCSVTA